MDILNSKQPLLNYLIVGLLFAITTSCASRPSDKPRHVNPPFSTVSVISAEDVISTMTSDTESERSSEGKLVGGVSGAASGALIGAAMCVPGVYLAPLCAVVYGMYGAIAGTVVGAESGSYLWGSTGLSDDDARYFKKLTAQLISSRDLNHELAESLREKLPSRMLQAPAEADVQVVPIIKSITIEEVEDEVAVIRMRGTLIFVTGTEDDVTRHGTFGFKTKSKERPLAVWLYPGGESINQAVDAGINKFADKISHLILEKAQSGASVEK